MFLPNWMYGFAPVEWWPDRPRELFNFTQNIIPLSSTDVILELTLAKSKDVMIWGGNALVTDTTGATVNSPAAGTSTQVLASLYSPSGAYTYTQVFQTIAGVTTPLPDGLVPLEDLFSCYTNPAQKSAYWPIPIRIKTGGSLGMKVRNTNVAQDKHVRITFLCSIIYDKSDRLPRAA